MDAAQVSSVVQRALATLCAPACSLAEQKQHGTPLELMAAGFAEQPELKEEVARLVAAHSANLVTSLQSLQIVEEHAHHFLLIYTAQLFMHSLSWCISSSSCTPDLLLRIGAVGGAVLSAAGQAMARLAECGTYHALDCVRTPALCVPCFCLDTGVGLIASAGERLLTVLVARADDHAVAALRRTCCRPEVVVGFVRGLAELLEACGSKIGNDGDHDSDRESYWSMSCKVVEAVACLNQPNFEAEQQLIAADEALQLSLARALLGCKRRLAAQPRFEHDDWRTAWLRACTSCNREWSRTGVGCAIQATPAKEREALISSLLSSLAALTGTPADGAPAGDQAKLVGATCADVMYTCEASLRVEEEGGEEQQHQPPAQLVDAALRAVAQAGEALAAMVAEWPGLLRNPVPEALDDASYMVRWGAGNVACVCHRLVGEVELMGGGAGWARAALACGAAAAAARLGCRLIQASGTPPHFDDLPSFESVPGLLLSLAVRMLETVAAATEAMGPAPPDSAVAAAAVRLAEGAGAVTRLAVAQLKANGAPDSYMRESLVPVLLTVTSRLCAAALGEGAGGAAAQSHARLREAAALSLAMSARTLAPFFAEEPVQQALADRQLLAGLAGVMDELMGGNEDEVELRVARALSARRCGNLECLQLPTRRGKLCSGCRLVRFCFRDCSKQAWPLHKHGCRLLAARHAEAAGGGPP